MLINEFIRETVERKNSFFLTTENRFVFASLRDRGQE